MEGWRRPRSEQRHMSVIVYEVCQRTEAWKLTRKRWMSPPVTRHASRGNCYKRERHLFVSEDLVRDLSELVARFPLLYHLVVDY